MRQPLRSCAPLCKQCTEPVASAHEQRETPYRPDQAERHHTGHAHSDPSLARKSSRERRALPDGWCAHSPRLLRAAMGRDGQSPNWSSRRCSHLGPGSRSDRSLACLLVHLPCSPRSPAKVVQKPLEPRRYEQRRSTHVLVYACIAGFIGGRCARTPSRSLAHGRSSDRWDRLFGPVLPAYRSKAMRKLTIYM